MLDNSEGRLAIPVGLHYFTTVILRLSEKLSRRIHQTPTPGVELHSNPIMDWSGHVFTFDRQPYILSVNTPSLFGMVFPGKGITSLPAFCKRWRQCLVQLFQHNGFNQRILAGLFDENTQITCARALDRRVTGSMSNQIDMALLFLHEGQTLMETADLLNGTPFSPLKYQHPREVFSHLLRNFSSDTSAAPQ